MALPAVQKEILTAEDAIAEADRRAATATAPEMVGWMQDVFGRGMTALVSGADDVLTVSRWTVGTPPPPENLARLRTAYHIATLIAIVDSPQTARAWFMGMNPDLEDRAAAIILADEPERALEVMLAARSFLGR